MNHINDNELELTSEDKAVVTAMRIPAPLDAHAGELPSRPKVISRLPVGNGHREIRVCTYKDKDQIRVDIRYWERTGKGDRYCPQCPGLNVAASQIVILQEALRRAAKTLEAA